MTVSNKPYQKPNFL